MIAVPVFAAALIARIGFGYPPVGREEPLAATDGGQATDEHGGQLATEPWLPRQYRWSGIGLVGLVSGILGGFIHL
jgi:hypothetical protein